MIASKDLLSCYKQIYVTSFIEYPLETDGKFSISLTETDPAAKLKKVTISDVPEKSMLLKLNEYSKLNIGNKMNKIINDEKSIFQCCDYLLMSEDESKLYMVFIEMKSTNLDRSHITSQFKGASCFMEYCNSIAKHFYGLPLENQLACDTSYVLLSWRNMRKTPTVKKNKYRKPLQPDEYIHCQVGNIKMGIVPFEWFFTYQA